MSTKFLLLNCVKQNYAGKRLRNDEKSLTQRDQVMKKLKKMKDNKANSPERFLCEVLAMNEETTKHPLWYSRIPSLQRISLTIL